MKRLGILLLLLLLAIPCFGALLFDGLDDRVVTSSVAGAPTGYPFTVVAVVRRGASGTESSVAQFGTYATGAKTGFGFYISMQAVRTLFIYNNAADILVESTASITEGTWLCVGVSSASATSHRFFAYNYENRTVVINETSSTNFGAITAPGTGSALGVQVNNAGAYSQFFIGTIAWVAAYAGLDSTGFGGDRFLAMAHLGPYATATPSLLYTFHEMTGTTVRDKRGTVNIGTMTNFPAAPWTSMALPGPLLFPQ